MLKPDIRSLQTGDRFSWECAFYWLWPVAWSAAQRRLVTFAPAEVEDVAIGAVSEAAEEVQAGNVRSFEELKALTAVIANRRALDYVRRMQAERRATDITETLEGREEPRSLVFNPLNEVNVKEVAELLVELAEKLPERHRELLKAYYLGGLKQAELAENFGMPIGTVGVTLSRALESLREELQKHPRLMKELKEAMR